MKSPAERFWSRVKVTDSCWWWLGKRHKDGYGEMIIDFKTVKAHRFSWRLHFGTDPGDLMVCHACDNPSCVNPGHLFLGTQTDNMRDMAR